MGLGIIIAGLWVVLDQATKAWAREALAGGDVVEVLGKALTFRYLENRGAAFGILQGNTTFFILITVLAAILLLVMMRRYRHMGWPLLLSLGLILGGAIGNGIDRLWLGYVVDFIQVDRVDFYQFPIFNVADIGVTVGVILFALLVLFSDAKDWEADHERQHRQ
ncbi:MAG: signal peptidase II [Peptoniphilaceae bacterium]|nr:signal peptidase II [Peptoniphilaceae bacterium]